MHTSFPSPFHNHIRNAPGLRDVVFWVSLALTRAPHSFLSGFIVVAQLPPLTSMPPHPFDCHHAARLPNGTDERERERKEVTQPTL